jgi:hypothetical protein
MATITATASDKFADNALYTFTPLANGDAGAAVGATFSGDRTVQVTGTFGAAGTCIVEGSLDGTNWFQLHDPANALISFTAAGLKAIMEGPPFIRPRVTGGDGTTALTCIISVRRS